MFNRVSSQHVCVLRAKHLSNMTSTNVAIMMASSIRDYHSNHSEPRLWLWDGGIRPVASYIKYRFNYYIVLRLLREGRRQSPDHMATRPHHASLLLALRIPPSSTDVSLPDTDPSFCAASANTIIDNAVLWLGTDAKPNAVSISLPRLP